MVTRRRTGTRLNTGVHPAPTCLRYLMRRRRADGLKHGRQRRRLRSSRSRWPGRLASRHYEGLRPAMPVLAMGATPADEERPDGLRGARYVASEKSTTPVTGRSTRTPRLRETTLEVYSLDFVIRYLWVKPVPKLPYFLVAEHESSSGRTLEGVPQECRCYFKVRRRRVPLHRAPPV
jgi:hypothetical protein